MLRLLFLCLLFFSVQILAQQSVKIVWHDQPFELDKAFETNDTIKIKISEFKCYLQGEDKTVFLLDASERNYWLLASQIQTLQVGLSPETQTSTRFLGPLDPIYGMYWAWNTGFISIKCVGDIYFSNSGKLQHFEYHLGGYTAPFACIYRIPSSGKTLEIDLSEWFANILKNDTDIYQTMHPCKEGLAIFTQFYSALRYVK